MSDPSARLLSPTRYDDTGERRRVGWGLLPSRYVEPWGERFEELVKQSLEPEMCVLDVGSGRHPVLSPDTRPSLEYVGLDISASELAEAPAGAYDKTEICSITEYRQELEGRFDLILSYQVFEHVAPLDRALANIGRYLRPGGELVALFSGRYSPMAVLNRAMPHRLARRLNQRLLDRRPATMFEAGYDRCYASAIRTLLADWSEVSIEPRWAAASYFFFARPVMRAYLALENRLAAGGWEDLATHYFLRAVR
jgi:SAM-dependent methyltransferase